MEIPGAVQEAIDRRCNHALRLQNTVVDVDYFIRNNGIELSEEYLGLGSAVVNDPLEAREKTMEAILKHPGLRKGSRA